MKTRTRYTALLGVLLAGATLASACGDDRSIAACYLWDASRSGVALEPEYRVHIRDSVDGFADQGADVAGLVVKGDARVEARPIRADFGDVAGFEKSGERSIAVGDFLDEVDDDADESLSDVRNPTKGSNIIGGLDVLGDLDCATVIVLSDGIERSRDVDMRIDEIATAVDRRALIETIERRHGLPDLDGADLHFPFGGRRRANGPVWTDRIRYVEPFWAEFAEATGANLIWR
ncbi:MAG: hypothetical protein GXY03_13805 [Solirubrobacterales bacterium]|nr:hypothetical protein [Solirubrobacterales bacterium]